MSYQRQMRTPVRALVTAAGLCALGTHLAWLSTSTPGAPSSRPSGGAADLRRGDLVAGAAAAARRDETVQLPWPAQLGAALLVALALLGAAGPASAENSSRAQISKEGYFKFLADKQAQLASQQNEVNRLAGQLDKVSARIQELAKSERKDKQEEALKALAEVKSLTEQIDALRSNEDRIKEKRLEAEAFRTEAKKISEQLATLDSIKEKQNEADSFRAEAKKIKDQLAALDAEKAQAASKAAPATPAPPPKVSPKAAPVLPPAAEQPKSTPAASSAPPSQSPVEKSKPAPATPAPAPLVVQKAPPAFLPPAPAPSQTPKLTVVTPAEKPKPAPTPTPSPSPDTELPIFPLAVAGLAAGAGIVYNQQLEAARKVEEERNARRIAEGAEKQSNFVRVTATAGFAALAALNIAIQSSTRDAVQVARPPPVVVEQKKETPKPASPRPPAPPAAV